MNNYSNETDNIKHYIACIPYVILCIIAVVNNKQELFWLGFFWLIGVYIFYSIKVGLESKNHDKKILDDLSTEKEILEDLLYKSQQTTSDLVYEFERLEKQFYEDKNINFNIFNEYIKVYERQINKINQTLKNVVINQDGLRTDKYEKDYYQLKEEITSLINNLKKAKEKLEFNKVECKNKIVEIDRQVRQFREDFVKQNSQLYKNLTKLNKNLKFYQSQFYRQYEIDCSSKNQFDNFNYEKYLTNEIDNEKEYYYGLETQYYESEEKYQEYLKKYKEIKNIMITEKEYKFSEMTFIQFNKIEKELYDALLQKKCNKPQIIIDVKYISPSGRNFYEDSKDYSFDEIISIVKNKENEEKQKLLELEKKQKQLEEKRAKEKRLRELDKLEIKLAQKEQEINKKEKEFFEATKEHIYTTDKIETKKQEIKIDENLSLTQKLKLLKEKFDNGEITYGEYQAKRKELI